MAMVIFVVVAVSNGVNLTDGLDGLATGTSAVAGVTLGILAYVSGNIIYANYLQYNVFTEHRRAGDLCRRLCRCHGGLPLV